MPVESIKKKKIRMESMLKKLKSEYPDAKCSLEYKSAFQLLVATILSAQCTDERVNRVTKKLFKKYQTPKDFDILPLNSLKQEIYSTGFYNNKAKNIKKMVSILVEKYNGDLPVSIDKLVKLPGVGRKTANVVLGTIYKIPSLVVDTHVTRISNLLKFVNTVDAVKIEKKLSLIVNKADWIIYAHLMIDHGRAVCIANRPQCYKCTISKYCPSNKEL